MAAVRHLGFSKTRSLSNGSPWAANYPWRYQIWWKNFDPRSNYGQKRNSKWRPTPFWIYFWSLFLTLFLLYTININHHTKFGANISIHYWIIVTFRNSRWRPSTTLDFRKRDFWAMEHLALPIFHHCTKFGAKMLIDAKIMAQNRNPRWRQSAILELLHHHIEPPTKSLYWSTSPCQILC